jgi:hypothetical protein
MVVVQELSNCDMENHSMEAEHLIRVLSKGVIILMTDEGTSTYLAVSTNRIFTTG